MGLEGTTAAEVGRTEKGRPPRGGRPPLLISFVRSHVASAAATAVDYAAFFILFYAFGVFYVTASALGAALGAVTHFTLGRYWCFEAADGRWRRQATRYALIAAGSLAWNAGGIYLFSDYFLMNEAVSKVIVGFTVGMLWNFPLHRKFVFAP